MTLRNDPALSIVIPHYNDAVRLGRCLEALMPHASCAVQVIVADNGSTENLKSLRERWPDVIFVDQPEKGAGPARNAGAGVASGRWLAFLDADCVPAPDWLRNVRDIAREDAVYSGLVIVFDETPPPRSGAEAFEAVFAFQMKRYLSLGFLPSCQLVMSRAAFDLVGGFRAHLSEDVDWSRRASAAGLQLELSHELVVFHPSRSDWSALRKKWRRLTSEGFLTEAQTPIGRLKWASKAVLMPISVLVHTPRVLQNPNLSGWEKIRALVTLARLRHLRMIWMLVQVIRGKN